MQRVTRRLFLARLTKGGFAIAALGTAAVACSSDAGDPTTTVASPTAETSTSAATTAAPATTSSPTTQSPATTNAPAEGTAVIERVDMGFVSAYVIARAGEAAVIDTGTSGNAAQIEMGLTSLGLEWGDVGHVVLTHLHGDHVGSLGDVMAAAADAVGYAGAADISGISSPRALTAVGDGDRVFDLDIIETPGHTDGSISVLDSVAGILVAGDALNGVDGVTVAGPNASFSSNIELADASVQKLAGLDFDSLYFGHGPPVESGAKDALVAFADSI